MPEIRYWQAINRALAEEMESDPGVVLIGEDVGAPGGAFGATRGLQERSRRSTLRPGSAATPRSVAGKTADA